MREHSFIGEGVWAPVTETFNQPANKARAAAALLAWFDQTRKRAAPGVPELAAQFRLKIQAMCEELRFEVDPHGNLQLKVNGNYEDTLVKLARGTTWFMGGDPQKTAIDALLAPTPLR